MSDSNNFGFNSAYIARMKEIFEERAVRDQISRDNYFFKKGFIEGFRKGYINGVKKVRIKNAISFMRNGAGIDIISKSLELSREELLDHARQNNIALSEAQLGIHK